MMLVLNLVRLVMEMTVSDKFSDFVMISDMLELKVKSLDDVKCWLKIPG